MDSLYGILSDKEWDVVNWNFDMVPPNEGFLTASNVQHVGKGANLYEANLLGANISGAIFDEANLSNVIWVDGKKCSLGSIGTCQ